MRPGQLMCCGGFAEHFEWCDPTDRERRHLHALLLKRGVVQDNPIVLEAYRVLADAEEAS
jgi:hypothetical protein